MLSLNKQSLVNNFKKFAVSPDVALKTRVEEILSHLMEKINKELMSKTKDNNITCTPKAIIQISSSYFVSDIIIETLKSIYQEIGWDKIEFEFKGNSRRHFTMLFNQ